jgi:predicted aspartyl protease
MGLVMTKIKLTNHDDLTEVAKGRLAPEAVRSVEVQALADTGAVELCIPEEIAELLGVPVTRHRSFTTADGRRIQATIVGPVEVEVIGRGTLTEAIVLPPVTPLLLAS